MVVAGKLKYIQNLEYLGQSQSQHLKRFYIDPSSCQSRHISRLSPVKTYFSTQYLTKKTPSPLRKKESPKCKIPTPPERPISTPHTSDESGDETERLAAVRRKIDVDESRFGGADPLDDLLENRRPAVKTGEPLLVYEKPRHCQEEFDFRFKLPALPEYVAAIENNYMSNELMNKMVRDSYAVLQSIVRPKPQAGDLKAMARSS